MAAPPPVRGQHALVAAILLVVNWVAAAVLVVLIAAGVDFHHCMCRNNTRFSRALRNKDAKYMQSGMT